ncbi:DnaJ domain-containing protein [Ramlibacter sp. MMS24-I3-19]|uniref:DnaJ domain-containing protein n=1 Tax=Ramlibacter sp. MMS24-I3-19 TaxID=3416606 RepID=UPI003D020336
MDVDECYQELGVAPGASDAEVKAAWRRLAARWHPDRNDSPEALRKIQRINRAIEEIRRSKQEAAEGDSAAHAAPAEPAVERTIDLSVEEFAAGCVRDLRGEMVDDCADCEGSGRQVHATACEACGGTGRVQQALWVAWLSPMVDCAACHGHGAIHQGCTACDGSGKLSRKYRCRVQVPPGVRAGQVLDAAAKVQGGGRGSTLALRVRIALRPHEFFVVEADGALACELPVDGFAWMANRWIDVPTPRGLQQMRLRRGVLNYRIKAAGLPWLDGAACADCIVTVVPLFPEEFGAEQEALVDRLVASNSGAVGTATGQRMAAWSAQLADWQAGLDATRS